jgi:hypothetical protein
MTWTFPIYRGFKNFVILSNQDYVETTNTIYHQKALVMRVTNICLLFLLGSDNVTLCAVGFLPFL